MEKKKYRLLEIVTGGILIIAVAVLIGIVTQISSKGYVSISGYSMFRVVTGSMEPTIMTGSLLICEETDIEEIEIGDIVCFKSIYQTLNGSVITHRVIDINNSNGDIRLITQGDANTVEDTLYVSNRNLLGRVVWYSQKDNLIASVISFMNGNIGFLAFIVLPVLLVCTLVLRASMNNIQLELNELKNYERELAHKVEIPEETEEELIARLRAEIRKELGLDDEGETTE